MLRLQVFEHRFDHQIALRQIVYLRRGNEIGHDGFDLRSRELAFLDGLREKSLRLLACFVQSILPRIEYDGAKPRPGRDDGDARAHGAASRNADGFDVHLLLDETLADELAMNLIRAFPNLGDFRVTH